MQSALAPPTSTEIRDATLVLEDRENELFAPALYLEATLILDEAGQKW